MHQYCLEVSGDFACFTRPEMKVERVSYDVMTPSAARAIFESILWKPAIRWQIHKIEVLNPVRWTNLRRNEVSSVVSVRNLQTAMKNGCGELGIWIEDDRQQRASLLLRDVAYRLHASFSMQANFADGNSVEKFHEMFQRRALKGQCVNQPYLGCREFACDFQLIEDPQQAAQQRPPIAEDRELGWMLYDLDYRNPSLPEPQFFQGQLKQGVLHLEQIEVRK